MARHGKPLTMAVLVLFTFLTGYSAFHSHESQHCRGDCSVARASHDTGEEVDASQTNCNLCYYAASPRIVHPAEHTGVNETGLFLPSVPERSTPCYTEEYSSPLRGPPAHSLG